MRQHILSYLFLLTILLFFFLSQPALGEYGISIEPEKQEYKPGEIVKINATVNKESTVTFQVKNPSNETIIVETIETENKIAFLEFQLENETEAGEYKIYVSAVSIDGEEQDFTTDYFNVSKESEGDGIWTIVIIIVVCGGSVGALVAFFLTKH